MFQLRAACFESGIYEKCLLTHFIDCLCARAARQLIFCGFIPQKVRSTI